MFFIHFYSSPLCPSFRAPCDCPISPFMSGIERAVMLTGIGLVPFYFYDDMLNYRSDLQHGRKLSPIRNNDARHLDIRGQYNVLRPIDLFWFTANSI